MGKTIINIINAFALLVSLYWASKKGFEAEQLLGVLTTLSTLITLNYDALKKPFISQEVSIIGTGNKAKQQATTDESAKQRLRIEGDDNEQEQSVL